MSNESKLYPLIYNPKIAHLLTLPPLDYGLDQAIPTLDEIDGMTGINNDGSSDLVQTGILESLNSVVKKIEETYNQVIYPEWTDDIVLNNKIQEGIDNYYQTIVYAQATSVCDHIDGLIQLDKYPKEIFGSYKILRNLIHNLNDKHEKVRALMQLKIIANSIIPIQIKYEQKETIEPSLISSQQVTEG